MNEFLSWWQACLELGRQFGIVALVDPGGRDANNLDMRNSVPGTKLF